MNFLLNISPWLKYKECFILTLALGEVKSFSLFKSVQKKGNVELDRLIDNARDFDLLRDIAIAPKGSPIILSLHGNGVVQRLFHGEVNSFADAIPNINPKDFFSQTTELDNQHVFVSLLRLKTIDQLIDDLNKRGILIRDIHLGFVNIARFKDVLEISSGKLNTSGQYIQIDNGQVISTGKTESAVGTEGDVNNDLHSVALSSAICFFVGQVLGFENRPQKLVNNIKEVIAQKITSLMLKYCLPVLMVLLLINFLLFDSYQKKIDHLSGTLGNASSLKGQIEQLKTTIKEEQNFIRQVSLHGNNQFAFFLDRISSLAVPSIRFEEFSINPIKKRIRDDEIIEYSGGRVVLRGTAKDEETFSGFLVKINQSPYDLKIEKQIYSFNPQKGKAQFELEIIYPER